MVKVKLIGLGPLSYVSVDHASDNIRLKSGEEAEVEFHTKLQVFGSPHNIARCNVQIILEKGEEKE